MARFAGPRKPGAKKPGPKPRATASPPLPLETSKRGPEPPPPSPRVPQDPSVPPVSPEFTPMDFGISLEKPIGNEAFRDPLWWHRLEMNRRRLRLQALLAIEDPEAKKATLRAEIALCRMDPCHWIDNYGFMEDPKQTDPERRKVPAVLWPGQRKLVEFLMSGLNEEASARNQTLPRLVIKGRELGVSWTAQLLIYNLLREEPGFKAKLGSRKEPLVDGDDDSLFEKLRFVHGCQPDFLKAPIRFRFLRAKNLLTKGEVTGEATNPGFARGGRRRVMLIDEFAHIEPAQLQARIWTAIQSVASTLWLVSSGNGPGNKFAELLEKLPADCVMEMPWQTDPRRDEEWRREQLKNMTEEEFAQEHEARIVVMRSGRVFTARKPIVEYWDDEASFLALGQPRKRFPLIGGWDFGSGGSLLVCLFAMIDLRGAPTIWIDQDLTWAQTAWRTAAADAKQVMARYGSGRHLHFGDPAGRQRESDQSSWERNLQAAGIPLICFDDAANTREGTEWAIKQTQALLADGRLRIHRRCEYLWSCIENWRREVPDGMQLDYVSRSYIPPRHDVYSHGGKALLYLISGILKAIASIRASAGLSPEEPISEDGLLRAARTNAAAAVEAGAIYEPQPSMIQVAKSFPGAPGIAGIPGAAFPGGGWPGGFDGGWD